MSFLIATEKYYDFFNILHLMIPLLVLNFALIVLGAYLIIRSLKRMHHFDIIIKQLKLKHTIIGELINWINFCKIPTAITLFFLQMLIG